MVIVTVQFNVIMLASVHIIKQLFCLFVYGHTPFGFACDLGGPLWWFVGYFSEVI